MRLFDPYTRLLEIVIISHLTRMEEKYKVDVKNCCAVL
jgi:hypothetical protein